MNHKGTTLAETMVALAIAALLVIVAVPSFRYMIRSTSLRSAARQATGDLREARAQAIATGWEWKLVGFGNASGATNKNQYRLMARQNAGVAWPADTSPVIKSSTQRADPWVNVAQNFAGVQLDPGGTSSNDRFEVVFDSRGSAAASPNDFSPFRVVGDGKPALISISSAGGITLQ